MASVSAMASFPQGSGTSLRGSSSQTLGFKLSPLSKSALVELQNILLQRRLVVVGLFIFLYHFYTGGI